MRGRMHLTRHVLVLAPVLAVACAGPDKRTLAELHRVEANTADADSSRKLRSRRSLPRRCVGSRT